MFSPSKGPKKASIQKKGQPYKKHKIPKAVREQVWIINMGRAFEAKCKTTWCNNTITVFDFESGHNIPESKGGPTTIENLIPLCSRCNTSMSNQYTFDEWCEQYGTPHNQTKKTFKRFFMCFS
jgi:5-methylcytosine-specific restriction endonuclease McrA